MPLKHRDEAFIPDGIGISFVLTDPKRGDVLCVLEPAALIAAAIECGMVGLSAETVFLELRSAIEACASDIYDQSGVAANGAVYVRAIDLLAA